MQSQIVTKFEGSPQKDVVKSSQPTSRKKKEDEQAAEIWMSEFDQSLSGELQPLFVSYIEEGRTNFLHPTKWKWKKKKRRKMHSPS